MNVHNYVKFADEIRIQQDLLMSTAKYYNLCQVFIQDVQLDSIVDIGNKAAIMIELQRHFIK